MGTPVKISQLPAASAAAAADEVAGVQSSVTVRFTFTQIKNWIWSIFTAKGDIAAATASGTVSRLAVGSDGQALKAASGQTTGLLWSADWQVSYNHVLAGPTAARTFTAPDSNTSVLKSDYCHVLSGPTAIRTYTLPDYDGAIPNGALRNLRVYTATDTWTKPTGLKRVKVTVVGGGGGSGGVAASGAGASGAAAGGGGGGAAIKLIEAASLGGTETVTIGAGGTAGTAGDNHDAGTGGTSSFGAHCSATGGIGGDSADVANTDGYGTTGSGGTGGVGSSGDINIRGGAGTDSARYGVVNQAVGGTGGDSILGGGSRSTGTAAASTAAVAGGVYGGGAAGGASGASQSALAGAAGGAGVIIVEEFY